MNIVTLSVQESALDVYRRQILTSKVDPRAEGFKPRSHAIEMVLYSDRACWGFSQKFHVIIENIFFFF